MFFAFKIDFEPLAIKGMARRKSEGSFSGHPAAAVTGVDVKLKSQRIFRAGIR